MHRDTPCSTPNLTRDTLAHLSDVAAVDVTPTPTVKEPAAARYIGLSRAYLRQGRALGRGPAFIRIGRSIRYRIQDLDAFLEHHRIATRDGR